MSKKRGLGKLFGLALVAGAVYAGYSLYKQYLTEEDGLSDDFDDFDYDTEFDDDDFSEKRTEKSGKYPELEENKNEFLDAAKETLDAAKGMISTGIELAKCAGRVLGDNTADIRGKAGNAYKGATDKAGDVYRAGADKAANLLETAKEKVHEVQNKLDEKINEFKAVPEEDINIDDIEGDISVKIEEENK